MDEAAKANALLDESPSPQARQGRRWFWLRLGGTALGLGFLAWVLAQQAWVQVWHLLQTLSRPLLGLALVGFLLGQVFNTLRWWTLLRAHYPRLPGGLVVRLSWVGYLTSNFLPSSVGGDGLRGAALLPYVPQTSKALASVVLDRLLNLLSMLCLLPVTVWVLRDVEEVREYLAWDWAKAAAPLALAALLLGAGYRWRGALCRRLAMVWRRWVHPWMQRPWGLFWAFLWAWMSNLVQIGSIYLLARAVGMPVSYGQVVGLHALIYLLVLLPISLNGIGVAESAYVVLYPLLGATPAQAAALALLARFLPLLVLLPGAFWLPRVLQEAAMGVKSLRQGGRDGNA